MSLLFERCITCGEKAKQFTCEMCGKLETRFCHNCHHYNHRYDMKVKYGLRVGVVVFMILYASSVYLGASLL